MKRKLIHFGLLAVLLILLLIFGCAKSTEKKIIYSGEASFAELSAVHPPSGPKFCYYLDLKSNEMPAGTTYDNLAYKYPLPSAATMWLEYKLYRGIRTEKGIFLNSCAGKTRVHWVCDGKAQKGGNWINYISGPGTKEEKLAMSCPSVIDPAATCSTHFIPPGLTVSIVNCKSKEHLIGLGYGCMDKGDDDSDGKIDCADSDCEGKLCDANKLSKKCKKFHCVDFGSPVVTNTTNNSMITAPINATNATITTPITNNTNATKTNTTDG